MGDVGIFGGSRPIACPTYIASVMFLFCPRFPVPENGAMRERYVNGSGSGMDFATWSVRMQEDRARDTQDAKDIPCVCTPLFSRISNTDRQSVGDTRMRTIFP